MAPIYFMYAMWFLAGAALVAYLSYRRKRKKTAPPVAGPSTPIHI